MIAHVNATVIDGALKLDHPIELPNNCRVAVRVESLPTSEGAPPTDEERRAAWERMKRRIEEHPVHGGDSASIETSCMTAVDTNVLVYAIDVDEPVKQQKAENLLGRLSQAPAKTFLLWQVVAEFLGVLRRWQTAVKISGQDAEGHLHDAMILFPVVLPTATALDRSIDLSRRYSLSHWDSMLLAACIEAGADTLYSEDLTDGITYGPLTVVNPFA